MTLVGHWASYGSPCKLVDLCKFTGTVPFYKNHTHLVKPDTQTPVATNSVAVELTIDVVTLLVFVYCPMM